MAFTEEKLFLTVIGDKIFGCYKLKGDNSDTTWVAPLSTIEGAWFQKYDDTDAGLLLSWSGATVTFGAAPDNGKYVCVFFVGY